MPPQKFDTKLHKQAQYLSRMYFHVFSIDYRSSEGLLADGRIVQVPAHGLYICRTNSTQHNKRFAPRKGCVYVYISRYTSPTRAENRDISSYK